jgi:hypothetical protein
MLFVCNFNFNTAIAMTGLNVVHDREKLLLGWQEADCKYHFSHQINGMTCQKKKKLPLASNVLALTDTKNYNIRLGKKKTMFKCASPCQRNISS